VARDECQAWEWCYTHRTENLSLSSSHPLLRLPPAHANLNHPPPASAVHSFLLLSDSTERRTRGAHMYANKHDHTTARSCLSHTPPLAIFRTHSSPPTLSLFLRCCTSCLLYICLPCSSLARLPSFFPISGPVVCTEVSLHVRGSSPSLHSRHRYSAARALSNPPRCFHLL